MKKRTNYEFDGTSSYTHICKKYGSNDVGVETHVNNTEADSDTVTVVWTPSIARSSARSLMRAIIESDEEMGVDCLRCIIDEHKEKLALYADSEE
jgi:ribosomal protein S12 methylthiotransferase accessory factor YcaO